MIIRLAKTDINMPVTSTDPMDLTYVGFDNNVYNWNWAGRGGILPVAAIEKGISTRSRTRDLRQIVIAADGDWINTDRVNILTKERKALRLPDTSITNTIILLGVASPNDWIAFQIMPKPSVYWIDIFINPLSEGEYGYPEVPKP